jgi:hypothetical protein
VPHETETAVTVAGVTLKSVVVLTEPSAAVIVEEPAAKPVARPDALIVATVTFDEVQMTELVMFAVEPSV